ncbi:hypothetical protein [Silvibacterium dinghuense]|uniref:Uncharacterized protein n=1 Tax=Silvibacterium dinghuense TaxID=1560006 RepID=A0A4V1NVY0_9BACT|nr:hypothetical protein [Silvibacterium dinghuense]RXS97492.1 hypothetical protein ESZ00_06260 [Silvibacterium dinghuense]
MKPIFPIFTAAFFFLAACNSATKPSAANFTAAINQYLAAHGQLCISTGSQFPIDVPASQQSDQHGIAAKLSALQHAGLVNVTNTTAVEQNLASSLSLSPRKPEPVKRYTVSIEGQKYLQPVMTDFGQTSGFCYGQKQVDTIVRWSALTTVGSATETHVAYTYRIVNLAPWGSRSDVQKAFPVIHTMETESKTNQVVTLQLGTDGWRVFSS